MKIFTTSVLVKVSNNTKEGVVKFDMEGKESALVVTNTTQYQATLQGLISLIDVINTEYHNSIIIDRKEVCGYFTHFPKATGANKLLVAELFSKLEDKGYSAELATQNVVILANKDKGTFMTITKCQEDADTLLNGVLKRPEKPVEAQEETMPTVGARRLGYVSESTLGALRRNVISVVPEQNRAVTLSDWMSYEGFSVLSDKLNRVLNTQFDRLSIIRKGSTLKHDKVSMIKPDMDLTQPIVFILLGSDVGCSVNGYSMYGYDIVVVDDPSNLGLDLSSISIADKGVFLMFYTKIEKINERGDRIEIAPKQDLPSHLIRIKEEAPKQEEVDKLVHLHYSSDEGEGVVRIFKQDGVWVDISNGNTGDRFEDLLKDGQIAQKAESNGKVFWARKEKKEKKCVLHPGTQRRYVLHCSSPSGEVLYTLTSKGKVWTNTTNGKSSTSFKDLVEDTEKPVRVTHTVNDVETVLWQAKERSPSKKTPDLIEYKVTVCGVDGVKTTIEVLGPEVFTSVRKGMWVNTQTGQTGIGLHSVVDGSVGTLTISGKTESLV